MNHKKLFLLFCLLPCLAQAESELTSTNQAKSSLQFQVIIPTILEVTNHYRPTTVTAGFNQEQLSITHNLRQLCLEAVLAGPEPSWRIETEEAYWEVIKTAQSYRLCTRNRGRISLNLKHYFDRDYSHWPVHLTFQPL